MPSSAQGHILLVLTKFSMCIMLLLIPSHSLRNSCIRAKIQVPAPQFMKEIMREQRLSNLKEAVRDEGGRGGRGGVGLPPKFLATRGAVS